MEGWLADKKSDEAMQMIQDAGVPAAPIYSIDQVVADPHIAGAREMFVEVEHPVAGPMKVTGCQIKFSDTKSGVRTPAPTLGQHTDEILKKYLGMDDSDIARLREQQIL